MASSRRSPRVDPDPVAALRDALAPLPPDSRVLVAFSGGLDSTVLLHAAAQVLPPRQVVAIHVDHGLQPDSGDWARHCVREAEALGIECRVARLVGSPLAGESIEAWARQRRYQAFRENARELGASALLTAHHADDQLETLLLRLARGAGLDGLVSIEADSLQDGLRVLRPLLGLPRSALEAWGRARGLRWIDDPSNTDEALLRNAVRRQLVPVIDKVLPSLRGRLPATLASLREARDRLRETDRDSLRGLVVSTAKYGDGLSLPGWRALAPARRAGVLRQWLALHRARMPTRARLAEMIRQLDSDGDGAMLELRHDNFVLRRYREVAMLQDGRRDSVCEAQGEPAATLALRWFGETRIDCPGLGGTLLIERVGQPGQSGIAGKWLRAPDLQLRRRIGGERLRVHPGGPHRSLKNLFQERSVPAWVRPGLPVLWARGSLIWVAGLGADADCLVDNGERYRLEWRYLMEKAN